MSKFLEKKTEIIQSTTPEEGKKQKKTFSKTAFNQLGTALLNDDTYEVEVVSRSKGEVTAKTINPSKQLKKQLIEQPLKAAGVDSAERAKIAETFEYTNLDLFDYYSELTSAALDTKGVIVLNSKRDMEAKITMEECEETIKENKSPQGGEATRWKYGAYKKVKVKSTCPKALRTKLD